MVGCLTGSEASARRCWRELAGATTRCVRNNFFLSLSVIKSLVGVLLTSRCGNVTGRETFLVKVDWIDDWPVFNEGNNIAILTQGRDPRPENITAGPQEHESIWVADLSKPQLELGWYQKSRFPGNSVHSDLSLRALTLPC